MQKPQRPQVRKPRKNHPRPPGFPGAAISLFALALLALSLGLAGCWFGGGAQRPDENAPPPVSAPEKASHPVVRLELNDSGEITQLGVDGLKPWLVESPIYDLHGVVGVTATLTRSQQKDGILVGLSLVNRSSQPVSLSPVFPSLHLKGADARDAAGIRYCFPARSARIGTEPASDRSWYGGIFPTQFMAADHPERGSVYAVLCDLSGRRKTFGMDKDGQGLHLQVEHQARTLAPGEKWDLPQALLGADAGTWHSGLHAYRRWCESWRRPEAPRSQAFRSAFNFRVYYLYNSPEMNSGIVAPGSRDWQLAEVVRRDCVDFGSVDFAHFFDWSQTPAAGRVGDYSPWEHLGGAPAFKREISQLAAKGIPAGLYFEGYLASPESQVNRLHAADWRMLDAAGKAVDAWGAGDATMCPHVPDWQRHLVGCIRKARSETGAAGVYVDQFGFLTQYYCHNPAHAALHKPGENMLGGELAMLRDLRAALGSSAVIYTEETPYDIITRYSDGSYTASVKQSLDKGIRCPVNMTRFALPDFKTFELVSEAGIGDNLPAVRAAFFNGEGLYLSGRTSTQFSPACLELIRKTSGLLRQHAEAFISEAPEPLVATLNPMVYANHFPARSEEAWTLFNAGPDAVQGPVLRLPHIDGAVYRDAWRDTLLQPRTLGGEDEITMQIPANGVTMLVRSLPSQGK